MATERAYQGYSDSFLEATHRRYVADAAKHAEYGRLAHELAAAHKECDVLSCADEMAAHHESMERYYANCALEVAAERRARDDEADKAADQHSHNRANGC